MITHNGKQVTLAMRNRKAINLIARNGKAMFGEFSAISWAARAVILAEYGKQVWSDVRDYAKAHPAIVPFINQDPHLACSISPNSNKERWLVGDGVAGIITNIIDFDAVETDVVLTALPTSGVFGYNYNNSGTQRRKSFGFNGSGYPTFGTGDGGSAYIQKQDGWSLNTEYHIRAEFGTTCTLYQNGVKLYEGSATRSNPIECGIMCINTGSGTQNIKGRGKGYEFYLQGESIAKFLPYNNGTECGMLDLVTYTFHPNANTQGTFTIAITDKE